MDAHGDPESAGRMKEKLTLIGENIIEQQQSRGMKIIEMQMEDYDPFDICILHLMYIAC